MEGPGPQYGAILTTQFVTEASHTLTLTRCCIANSPSDWICAGARRGSALCDSATSELNLVFRRASDCQETDICLSPQRQGAGGDTEYTSSSLHPLSGSVQTSVAESGI